MEGFCKQRGCPASERLVAFADRNITDADREACREHLALCEFCSAEVRFYQVYPPLPVGDVVVEEMPEPLHELAEALLQKNCDLTPLYRLIGS